MKRRLSLADLLSDAEGLLFAESRRRQRRAAELSRLADTPSDAPGPRTLRNDDDTDAAGGAAPCQLPVR